MTDTLDTSNEQQPWYSAEDGLELLSQFKSKDELAARLMPAGQSEDEDWSHVYAKLGRPDSPAEYTFDLSDLPEEARIPDEAVAFALEEFHKAGFSAKQTEEIARIYKEVTSQDIKTLQEEREKFAAENTELMKHFLGAEHESKAKELQKFFDTTLAKRLPEVHAGLKEVEGLKDNALFLALLNDYQNLFKGTTSKPPVPSLAKTKTTDPADALKSWYARNMQPGAVPSAEATREYEELTRNLLNNSIT